MDPKLIGLVGVHGTVIAFRRDTGARLWSTHLKSSGFVTVVSDTDRVYAHTGGELFCLNLQTGTGLWQDGLAGLGYGVGSLALPGQPAPIDPVYDKKRQEDAAAAASSSTATT